MRKTNHVARTIIAVAALTVFVSVATAAASELKFRPLPGEEPVIGRYLVTLSDSVAADTAASSAEALARSCGGQLEPYASSNAPQSSVAMLPSRARPLSAEAHVQ